MPLNSLEQCKYEQAMNKLLQTRVPEFRNLLIKHGRDNKLLLIDYNAIQIVRLS